MNITNITLGGKYGHKQAMLESLADSYIPSVPAQFQELPDRMALTKIDAIVKSGQHLSFQEAFSGMALVIAATNNVFRWEHYPDMSYEEAISKGTAFLQLLAVKESLTGLVPEEVAGLAAAGMCDLIIKPSVPEGYVVETCGMGGDSGWGSKKVKTINASTLSAIVLASLGLTTFKHGSYGNTTAVGSTDVPVSFGACICNHSQAEIEELIRRVSFWYSDAHAVKTLHYLSHLLMVETVNHIVGPMTMPVGSKTTIYKVMGDFGLRDIMCG